MASAGPNACVEVKGNAFWKADFIDHQVSATLEYLRAKISF